MILDELNALADDALIEKVAVEVMGWTKQDRDCFDSWKLMWCDGEYPVHAVLAWRPTRDWNHTMEVVAQKKRQRLAFHLFNFGQARNWQAQFGDGSEGTDPVYVIDEDPCRAICLAALLVGSPRP